MNKNRCFLTFSFTLFALSSCGINRESPQENSIQTSSIVNGKAVTKKDEIKNSIVAIIGEKTEGQFLCTGSIVSKGVILTAAHCMEGDISKLSIIFGANIKSTKPENIKEVDQFLVHPKWGKHLESGEADIALVHYKGELPKDYVPLKLADKKFVLKETDSILMIGFGVTDGDKRLGAGKLRQTTSEVLGRRSDSEIITDGEVSSVCFGDSGGPGLFKINGEWIQWGIASSVTNSTCDESSVHTEVMKYDNWIKSGIKKLLK